MTDPQTPIQDRLREADSKRTQLITARARDEVTETNATAAVAEVKTALKDEFGIENSADLARVRQELDAELEQALSEAEAALEAAS